MNIFRIDFFTCIRIFLFKGQNTRLFHVKPWPLVQTQTLLISPFSLSLFTDSIFYSASWNDLPRSHTEKGKSWRRT